MDFKSQYKHPEWQKKRLAALEEAEFTCQRCYDNGSTLHVHHRQYFKGRMIWEYANSELEVLCEPCHEAAHADLDEFKQLIAIIPTECLQGIVSLITGYASIATGPIRMAGFADKVDVDNPFEYFAGQVAAAAMDACSINEIQALSRELRGLYRSSGELRLVVSERKSAFDGFYMNGCPND